VTQWLRAFGHWLIYEPDPFFRWPVLTWLMFTFGFGIVLGVVLT
jgi:hypothetical protein